MLYPYFQYIGMGTNKDEHSSTILIFGNRCNFDDNALNTLTTILSTLFEILSKFITKGSHFVRGH